MKKCVTANQVKYEIDEYEKHFTGSPLVVGFSSIKEYKEVVSMLIDDNEKHIIRLSEYCSVEFPPNPNFFISTINRYTNKSHVIWLGASQASMLYGKRETEDFFINVLGCSFGGPTTILCPYCNVMLETLAQRYFKLSLNIVLCEEKEPQRIPSLSFAQEGNAYGAELTVNGIKALLDKLECGTNCENIQVITTCTPLKLGKAMFPISNGRTAYQCLCQKEPGIMASLFEDQASSEQWNLLLDETQKAGNLSNLIEKRLCAVNDLPNEFGRFLSQESFSIFLSFVGLKIFWSKGQDYLAYCLTKTNNANDLERNVYRSILDLSHDDERFLLWIKQRKHLLDSFSENKALQKEFCDTATIKRKNILWYLNDSTEEGRAAIIHALSCYEYSYDELEQVFSIISPQLNDYIRLFVFDEYNTKLMESDKSVRDLLTNYFHLYKLQKITNRTDESFISLMKEEAENRSFTKLQSRSAIIKKINKTETQPYFFDALGVEFLSFIRTRAEEYGMQFECLIGHCNLPSITSRNKEFYDAFPEGSILKEDGLDEIKHRGVKYDFRLTPEPLHIFDELALIDKDLRKMSTALALGTCQCIIILSDHGASRLAVTYKSENEKIQLEEDGIHSGRCCPTDKDPQIPYVIYEDGFAVLANYDRFKGSRKADVETHGGASLEETIVPVIQLTLKQKERQIFFENSVITCSPKEGSTIRLFANPPINNPRIVVGEFGYEGRFDGDKHNVVFDMPDIKRKGIYKAEIFDAGIKITDLTFETKRQTSTNNLI